MVIRVAEVTAMFSIILGVWGAALPSGRSTDLWSLARANARRLRMSTLMTADQVTRYGSSDAGVRRAIGWCMDHGITRVYIESYRDAHEPSDADLIRARDAFRKAGFLVSGCITTTRIGKYGSGWGGVSCYTDAGTRRELERIFRRAAALFDEIMIDDFLFTDCTCEECTKARGARSWADFRCDLMLEVSKKHILDAVRAVNPRCKVIIKYPCWHETFQDRGYDVVRETEAFDKIWVGTETRGGVPRSGWVAEPQYRAYWLMRWLGGIGGAKCGGGWYDWIGTIPVYYLEQARLTILGGARESMLFNLGALMEDRLGQQDIDALRAELPSHFELARLIAGKKPRGLLGWKPPSSAAGSDTNLHCLLGMAGFPVIAAHKFDTSAGGFVFAHQAKADRGWKEALDRAVRSGKPVLLSADLGTEAGAKGSNVLVLPANRDANTYRALAAMPQAELDALRDRATSRLGLRFHAPYGVGLWLFGRDTIVLHSFRDEPTECELVLGGQGQWRKALVLPPPASVPVATAGTALRVSLPPRAMVLLQRR